MDLSGLETLKQKLVESKDLAVPFRYFIDHFGGEPAFHELGQGMSKDSVLEGFIAGIGQQWFGTNVVRLDLKLCEIPEASFVHGICWINGRQSNVIYFDDIKVGLVVLLPIRRGELVQYSRFTGRKLPPEANPSDN